MVEHQVSKEKEIKEFVSEIEKIIPAKELIFPSTPGFGKYKALFPPSSVSHPAKMNTNLLEYLILNYTKEGENILDPMAGTGSTGVLSALLGRNAVLVELERKFVETITGVDCDGYTCHVLNCYRRKDIEKEIAELDDKLRDVNEKEIEAKVVWKIVPLGDFAASEEVDEEKTPPEIVKIWNDMERLKKLKEELEALPRKPHHYTGALENLKKGQFLTPIGSVKTIQGDARKLSELLSKEQTDNVITSPPYSEGQFDYKHGMNKYVSPNWKGRKAFEERRKPEYSEENITLLKHGDIDAIDTIITSPPYGEQQSPRRGGGNIGFVRPSKDGKIGTDPKDKCWFVSESPDNIANLKHGNIDAIITSPPYADTPIQDYGTSNKALLEFEAEVRASFKEKGYFEYNGKRYTEEEWRAINKGELKPRGMPELWAKILKNRQDSGYNTANANNIGNLPIGNIDTIDAVITSPPYGERRNYQDIERSRANIDKYFKEKNINPDLYAEDPANINRLEHKEDIDTIITSPPYAESLYHLRNKPKEFWEELSKRTGRKAWLDPNSKSRKTQSEKDEGYGKGKENIRNLPYEVDAIITSPPYERQHQGGNDTPKVSHGCIKEKYPSQTNIGNLPLGKIDVAITSPPYEDTMGEKRHASPNTGSAEKIVKEKHLGWYPTTPSNIGSMKRETYLEAMFRVYSEMYAVLKEGGRAIIVVKPFQRQGRVIDLPYQTWLLLEKIGFQLEDVLKLRLDKLSFWRILQYKKRPEVPRIMHEYILVCKKP